MRGHKSGKILKHTLLPTKHKIDIEVSPARITWQNRFLKLPSCKFHAVETTGSNRKTGKNTHQ